MSSRVITLVKHARPEKLEGVDSHEWPLSAAGRDDAARLATLLSKHPYTAVFSSEEPKAKETAQILAAHIAATGGSVTTHPALHEHDRSNVPLMRTPEFVSAIANFFHRPTQLVLGLETAKQALKRFEKAIDEVLVQHPTGDIIIVAHGTVISLWLETYAHLDAYSTWREMGLPSYISISWPHCDLTDRKDRI
jgi:broad specificity phosphatase PhoE